MAHNENTPKTLLSYFSYTPKNEWNIDLSQRVVDQENIFIKKNSNLICHSRQNGIVKKSSLASTEIEWGLFKK